MAITRFYNHIVSTQRMSDVGGGSKRQNWQESVVGVPCAIIPENGELFTVQGSAFYNRFKLWCDTTYDIQIGDRITDENGDIYSVIGRATFDGTGSSNKHNKFIIIKGK